MRCLLLGILLLLCYNLLGQLPLLNPYNTLNAASLRQADASSWHLQPATLVANTRFAAGAFAFRRFMLSNLTHSGIIAVVPLGRQALGLVVQNMGGLPARQSEISFGFAQSLGSQASVGMQIHYQLFQAMGYRQQPHLGYTLSGRLQLAPQVQALASVTNPVAIQRNAYYEHSFQYELGLGADISDDLFLGCTVSRRADGPPSVQAGLQYRLMDKCFARLGVYTGSGQFLVGGGYRFKQFRLDVYTAVHPRLGLSPGIQLLYQPPAKE